MEKTRIKKILSTVLISIFLCSNMVFAINENNNNIELPNEAPAVNFEENNKIEAEGGQGAHEHFYP